MLHLLRSRPSIKSIQHDETCRSIANSHWLTNHRGFNFRCKKNMQTLKLLDTCFVKHLQTGLLLITRIQSIYICNGLLSSSFANILPANILSANRFRLAFSPIIYFTPPRTVLMSHDHHVSIFKVYIQFYPSPNIYSLYTCKG